MTGFRAEFEGFNARIILGCYKLSRNCHFDSQTRHTIPLITLQIPPDSLSRGRLLVDREGHLWAVAAAVTTEIAG